MPRKSYSRAHEEDFKPAYIGFAITLAVSIGLMFSQQGEAKLRQKAQIQTDTAVSPLLSLLAIPVRGAEDFFASVSDRQRAFEENLALREELARLREEKSELRDMNNRLARYETILSRSEISKAPLEKVIARVVSDVNGPFVRALLVNAGNRDGVKKGQAVLSETGMVGHIILAGENSSRVLRLDDLNSRIPVKSIRSNAVAVLGGDNTPNPKLMFIDIGKDWEIGDEVVTSGDDGQLPRGLRVGTVIQAEENQLRVSLSGFENPLDWVQVVKFESILPPEDQPVVEIQDQTEQDDVVEEDTTVKTPDSVEPL